MAENNGPQMHHPQAYQRLNTRPSASPPNANGLLPPQYRQHTPQPHPGSRPTSRNHNPISRPNSTLGHPPNGYSYMAAPPHNGAGMQAPHPGPYPSQHHPQSQHYQGYPQPVHYLPPDHARNAMQQYSQPPPPERLAPQATMKVERRSASPPHVQEPPRSQNDHLQPQPVRAMAPRSKSIFTPIDAGSSLADSWRVPATSRDDPKTQEATPTKPDSPDTRSKSNSRNAATAGRPQFAAPERTLSVNSASGGSRRPRLNLTIPSEQSEDETGQTGASSPQQSGDTGTSATQNKSSEPQSTSHSGVILPPPSPSTLLSASATGPPNPFARPLPPNTTNSGNNSTFSGGNNIETPISALPSRFLDGGMLPSPSAFYPEWAGYSRSGGGDGNLLPSPLTFPTPTQGTGSGFGNASKDVAPGAESESQDRKRKTPESDSTVGAAEKRAAKKAKADS